METWLLAIMPPGCRLFLNVMCQSSVVQVYHHNNGFVYLKARETFLTEPEKEKKKVNKFQNARDMNTLAKLSSNAKQRNDNVMVFHPND